MKKNVIMRVASALGVAVLLTTCAISSTFAKYTTEKSASDDARVAKFGVKITANGETFAMSYTNDKEFGTTTKTAVGTVNTVENKSGDGKNLVAPGTKGTLANSKISGTPEVAVSVTYDATLTLNNWTVGESNTEYCPLIFTVNGETYGITGMKTSDSTNPTPSVVCDDIADLKLKVEGAIEAYSADYYAVGTDLGKIGANGDGNVLSVSWEWAFTGNNDANDTALGDSETPATIDLTIKTTVTQID